MRNRIPLLVDHFDRQGLEPLDPGPSPFSRIDGDLFRCRCPSLLQGCNAPDSGHQRDRRLRVEEDIPLRSDFPVSKEAPPRPDEVDGVRHRHEGELTQLGARLGTRWTVAFREDRAERFGDVCLLDQDGVDESGRFPGLDRVLRIENERPDHDRGADDTEDECDRDDESVSLVHSRSGLRMAATHFDSTV